MSNATIVDVVSDKTKVIIVGAGIFGMSTALWMLQDGQYDVTILDKSPELPARSAASNGMSEKCEVVKVNRTNVAINKIVRAGDYSDKGYAELAYEAVEAWRKPEWEGVYHETGLVKVASQGSTSGKKHVEDSYHNLISMGISAKLLNSPAAFREVTGTVPTADFHQASGYVNPLGGWVEATRAVQLGLKRIEALGGTIGRGCKVDGLIVSETNSRKVEGVKLEDGNILKSLKADIVVIAVGAWTTKLFATFGSKVLSPPVISTAQSIAAIQLSPDEVKQYSSAPVFIDAENWFYVFQPTAQGAVKFAQHSSGSIAKTVVKSRDGAGDLQTVSAPPAWSREYGDQGNMIPLKQLKYLRQALSAIYPELAKKDFAWTRLCWYSDTANENWVIDYHPDFDNLVVATGDSGHAFKYTPVIGREILNVVKKKPNPKFGNRWTFEFNRQDVREEGVRTDQVEDLTEDRMAVASDLLYVV